MECLDSINVERIGRALERCLLSTDHNIFQVPWEDVVHPELISRTKMMESMSVICNAGKEGEGQPAGRDQGSLTNTDEVQQGQEDPDQGPKVFPAVGQSPRDNGSWHGVMDNVTAKLDQEGEYVEVADIALPLFSPQKGSLTQSISLKHKKQSKPQTSEHVQSKTESPFKSSTCSQTTAFTTLMEGSLNNGLPVHSLCPVVLNLAKTQVMNEPFTPEHYVAETSSCVEDISLENEAGLPESQRSFCDNSTVADLQDRTSANRRWSGGPVSPADLTDSLFLSREACTEECKEGQAGENETADAGCCDDSLDSLSETAHRSTGKHDKRLTGPVPASDNPQQQAGTESESSEGQSQVHTATDCAPVSSGLMLGMTTALSLGKRCDEHPEASPTEAESDNPAHRGSLGENVECPSHEDGQVTGSEEGEKRVASLNADFPRRQHEECKMVEDETSPSIETHDVLIQAEDRQMDVAADQPKPLLAEGDESLGEKGSAGDAGEALLTHNSTKEEDEEDQGESKQEGEISDEISDQVESREEVQDGREKCATESRQIPSDCSVPGTDFRGSHGSAPLTRGTGSTDLLAQPMWAGSGQALEEPGKLGNSQALPAVGAEEWGPESGFTGRTQGRDPEMTLRVNASSVGSDQGTTTEDQQQALCGQEEEASSALGCSGSEENPTIGRTREPPPPWTVSSKTVPALTEAQSLNSDVLNSGVLCLLGTRDKCGRALVTAQMKSTSLSNPNCNCDELVRILLYFYSITREEVRALGLTVLVDARRCSPVLVLLKALNTLQEVVPGYIHTVLLLTDKDPAFRVEKPSAEQFELLTSLKSLHKHVDSTQLPKDFDGSFAYCHNSWICFRTRVEHLTKGCQDAIDLLESTISDLEGTPLPPIAKEAQVLLGRYRTLMCTVLEDSRLLRLQLEGGAALSRLRKEESSVSLTEDYRETVEVVGVLYDRVDELVHRLVTLSNKRTQELEFIVEFETLEEGFEKVASWIVDVGETQLRALSVPEDSLEELRRKQTLFRGFYSAAYEHCKRGEALLSRLERWEDVGSAELQAYEAKVRSFCVQLGGFSQRVEDNKARLDKTARLYEFFDKAYEWSLEGMRHLACISMEDCGAPEKCTAVIRCLEGYRRQRPEIPDSRFQEMKELARELGSDTGVKQWMFAWSKCQETRLMFAKKLEAAMRTQRSLNADRAGGSARDGVGGTRQRSGSSVHQQSREHSGNNLSSCRKGIAGGYPAERMSHGPASSCPSIKNCGVQNSPSAESFGQEPGTPHTPLGTHKLIRAVSSELPLRRSRIEAQTRATSSSHNLKEPQSESGRRSLRKTLSFDQPANTEGQRYGTYHRTLSDPARRGNTGVFIKGLEVSGSEVVDRSFSPRLPSQAWMALDTFKTNTSIPEAKAKGSKLRHIVDEMVATERDYVRSLRYVVDSYFPEMERPDLPQDLRGKRSVIFGNLEKLLDFHGQYFLKELESCCSHPLRVSHCFLRHHNQFGLYALYSKNKPKSDVLLATHGNSFFRNKQLELEDKMDLASYLLKPIQRMSKYALLLKDLIKEVSETQEQELGSLQAAAQMVTFQLRHGNDLLAMDAIRDCDVNLKEQGQLVRQGEFTISYGRKKCQRHVFLFEDLVLFSKPKRIEGGLDVYIYKHSFKTADVGMTETTGNSGLRFEIWFRRRTSKNQTYILQASTPEIKHVWTSDIAQILWQQASRNKEIRMQEMVSMGVGNKPFLDIKPSNAAINDRAIDYLMKGKEARTRASIAVSLFDHSKPFKRPQVTASPRGSPSPSVSLLGPLNLHTYSGRAPLTGERPLMGPCLEEDEQEHETGSQPSMTTESSGSSSQSNSASGSSGSDSGRGSGHLPEVLSEGSGSPSEPSFRSAAGPRVEDRHCFSRQYISAKSGQIISQSATV